MNRFEKLVWFIIVLKSKYIKDYAFNYRNTHRDFRFNDQNYFRVDKIVFAKVFSYNGIN